MLPMETARRDSGLKIKLLKETEIARDRHRDFALL
jgi:hypothetical protein